MNLVAVLTDDSSYRRALAGFRPADRSYYLHVIGARHAAQAVQGLAGLEFAGALLLDEEAQVQALSVIERTSLDVQELGACDTVTVTIAGLYGDYLLGRALAEVLRSGGGDVREARGVVLGSDREARAIARELASMGFSELTLIGRDRPAAEQAVTRLAASTRVSARVAADPGVVPLLERADLLVRTESGTSVPDTVMGPHLTVVDLVPELLSMFRDRALNLGARTFNRRDVTGHQLALALRQLLGTPVDSAELLAALHAA